MARPRPLTHACLALAVVACGCGDEVVGYFGGSSSGGAGSEGAGSTAASSSSSEGGPAGLIAPGCLADDFEDGQLDPMLWNSWLEQDASLSETAGRLELVPPSFGVWDTGVVGAYQASFPFVDGRVRMRVPAPPASSRPVVLFLRVLDDTGHLLSIRLSEGVVRIDAAADDVEQYAEEFAKDPYPAWLAIRAEGALVHYEISNDGVGFTTLTTRDKLASFELASALIMAQTYGDDADRSMVGVDDFEVCVQ